MESRLSLQDTEAVSRGSLEYATDRDIAGVRVVDGVRGTSRSPIATISQMSMPAPPGANVGEQQTDLGSLRPLANHSSCREVPACSAERRENL